MRSRIKNILVTGGAGFIGSAFIRYCLGNDAGIEKMVNLDLLTYAADLSYLKDFSSDPRYVFLKGDICDEETVTNLLKEHDIDTIVHFAAESHVDRSIESPIEFYRTNIEGTIHLLEVVRKNPTVRFHHVSTDEVYGSLGFEGVFSEESPYKPNSPYAASKASSDHFVRAYVNTYGIFATITHCSNNYGPCQNTEKFIPRMIQSLVEKKPLPIYGKGLNVRDWLYVLDHVEAIFCVLQNASKGSVYDIGGGFEASNLEIVHLIIEQYANISGNDIEHLKKLVQFIPDRLGHDFRYSIDSSKIRNELGWKPRFEFTQGLQATIKWYLQEKFSQICEV